MNGVVANIYNSLDDRFKFNDYIGRGYGAIEMKNPEELIDTLLSDIGKKPDDAEYWLEFTGIKRMTPKEEYEDNINITSPLDVDITKSDYVKYSINFIYHGPDGSIPMTKKEYMPAIDWRDSSLRISGTKWYQMPIWTDPKLAPLPNGVGLFSKLYKNKTKILTKSFLYKVNGIKKLKTFLVFEDFYTLSRIEKTMDYNLKNLVSPMSGFLLVSRTLNEVLSHYADAKYGIDFEILKGKFKPDRDYIYIGSTGLQHSDIIKPYPERHDYTIKVKRGSSRLLFELAYSLIYMFDAGVPEADRVYKSLGTNYEIDAWRLLLGRVTFKGAFEEVFTIQTLEEHMKKVNSYIDTLISKELEQIGIYAKDMNDYIVEIINHYIDMTTKGQNYYMVVREKRLEVLYYVMYILINKINKHVDDINQQIYHNKNFTTQHVNQILKNTFKPKDLFNIGKTTNRILPLLLFDTTRDNRIYGITVMADVQERGNGPFKAISKKGGGNFPITLKQVTAADAYRCTLNYLSKSAPSGRLRLGVTGKWKNGNLIYEKDVWEDMNLIDELLTAHMSNIVNKELKEMTETVMDIDE